MKRVLVLLAIVPLLVTGLAAWSATAADASGARGAAAVPKAVNGATITRTFRSAIAALPVRGESRSGYVRTKFKLWDDVDHDCQNTRSEVLRQETRAKVTGACAVRTGKWVSPYDRVTTTQASSFDIDHLVPLAEAWDSGARGWSAQRREAYANDLTDPRTLVAVSASANRSKGDRDPAEWMPALHPCKYVLQWTIVKTRWSLSVNPAEKQTLQHYAAVCPDWTFTTHRAVVRLVGGTSTSSGSGSGGSGSGGAGCTPGYSPCLPPASDYDCAGGGGNGPKYVYGTVSVTGSDPYGLDADHDGIGCD
jgi:hypothetical protein